MKNRVFVALLLAVVLALPAVAQQSGSITQDQPAASQPATSQSTGTATQDQPAASQPATSQSTGTATQDQPAASQPAQSAPAAPADQNTTQTAGPGASGKPALQPDTHEGFWGHLNPFARKRIQVPPETFVSIGLKSRFAAGTWACGLGCILVSRSGRSRLGRLAGCGLILRCRAG